MEQLEQHEGRRSKPYRDTMGKITIGVGRNLTDKGLSDDEIDYLLSNDVRECIADLETFPWWGELDAVRQGALIDMRFQLGAMGFRKFKTTLRLIADGRYGEAADAMLKSKWAAQVPARAKELARQMRTGLA